MPNGKMSILLREFGGHILKIGYAVLVAKKKNSSLVSMEWLLLNVNVPCVSIAGKKSTLLKAGHFVIEK